MIPYFKVFVGIVSIRTLNDYKVSVSFRACNGLSGLRDICNGVVDYNDFYKIRYSLVNIGSTFRCRRIKVHGINKFCNLIY